jgi:hypothetical protein
MMAGGVAVLLSGCQKVFWWRQKPDAVTVADRPSSLRPGPSLSGATALTKAPELNRKPDPGPQAQPQPQPQPPEALPAPKKFTYPVALAVPGREGYVLSPFNQRLVDASGFKSGALVADPHYPLSDKKFFRVP